MTWSPPKWAEPFASLVRRVRHVIPICNGNSKCITWAGAWRPGEERMLFVSELPEYDYRFRSQAASPQGLDCLYPSMAYETDSSGDLIVRCHPERKGSLFASCLPDLFDTHSPCPSQTCVCLDKYSFLHGFEINTSLNPPENYRRVLQQHRHNP